MWFKVAWWEGGAGTFEQHKLTMTYPIRASVTAALLDAARQSLSTSNRNRGRARACCDDAM